ncbi:ABC transporter permease [Rhodohalobacter sp. SW132]|uniref:ABC transporter permease n=1 Tax=Rhodohalobacter sp. SW132 TaxID=2293433 RepID=UPI000E233F20|nr:FtsX-like permease family protein [Rhodohalobacter sp. SW132]REL38953.1 ABC transporter permease [Rhodohalobacter sp. SW132]
MKMLLSISWRNIWRHPARSGVLIMAIIAGLWAGILVSALTNGWIHQRFVNMIQEEITHAQIHHPEYLTEREPWMYIENPDDIFTFLDRDARVNSWSARTLTDGMIQSPLTSSGVQIRGVQTDRERATTTFHENLTEGDYLDSELRNPVLLGERLADKLNVEVGNRIVLTFQDLDNEITSGSFTISGLFRTASNPYDERNVFVRNEDLQELLGDAVFHEIAVMLQDEDLSDAVTGDINNEFENITAESWYELSPELRYITDMGGGLIVYIMAVIMLALAFGILNTMLMAIFERMRELGMLLAIGMNKMRVFFMIMLESVILTLTGAAGGLLLAWLTLEYLGEKGIDMTAVGGESMAEFGYDAVVYPIAYTNDYITTITLVVITALLAAIYPAFKALRLNPGEVVRE